MLKNRAIINIGLYPTLLAKAPPIIGAAKLKGPINVFKSPAYTGLFSSGARSIIIAIPDVPNAL